MPAYSCILIAHGSLIPFKHDDRGRRDTGGREASATNGFIASTDHICFAALVGNKAVGLSINLHECIRSSVLAEKSHPFKIKKGRVDRD